MSIRVKFALGLVAILVVNLSAGLYAMKVYKEGAARAAGVCERTDRIVATSLTAQVLFKKQVQEWKNILIRGHEEALYQQYFSQFEREERETRRVMNLLMGLLEDNPPARRTAQEFLDAHVRLGQEYREALTLYRADTPSPHIPVDERVRGFDRRPTDLLDEVVAAAQSYKASRVARIEASTRLLERRLLLIVAGIMIGSIAFLIGLVDRTIGRPIMAATGIARRVAGGDFDGPIARGGRDEAAQMLTALDLMRQSLAQSRDTLRRSEERTRLILEAVGEGVYGVDLGGRCIFCNPAAARMLGYDAASELVGREMHELAHHSHADGSPYPSQRCPASRTYREGVPAHVEDEVFWRADGRCFPVEYHSQPIRQDGVLVGAVVNFSDISARKEAEAALHEAHRALQEERASLARRVRERTAELDRANAELAGIARAKDEFLAAMSHELRTPLTTILGISETLEDGFLGALSEQQRKAARAIHESGNHLLALINDILDVAKVESGKMVLNWDWVPVEQLCDSSLRLVRQPAQSKGLATSFSIDPKVRLVRGDSRRLKQMLVNLLSNAVKFTPEGGAIGLDVVAEPEQRRVRFQVWDTGIGIPPDHRDKLFQPFVQLDSKLSRQYSGTGLGLALVRGMAELHQGEVGLESEVGKGSRFCVYLPWDAQTQGLDVQPSSASGSPPARAEIKPAEQTRILLADDNQANAEMLADYLTSLNYQVRVARNGVETVAIAGEWRPDLILMDIQMPEMDGLEATRRLRADPSFHTTPMIALTALAMPGDRERCLEAGLDEYLSKPVGLKELHKTLRTWLRRSQGE